MKWFLICALSLPTASFTHPAIVSYHAAKSEQEQLKSFIDWLKKRNDAENVFITPRGQDGKLKKYGWEKTILTWKDQEIWIQRKPKTDKTPSRNIVETSA